MSEQNVEIVRRITRPLDTERRQAARMQSYWERADALEAVGLSEEGIHADSP